MSDNQNKDCMELSLEKISMAGKKFNDDFEAYCLKTDAEITEETFRKLFESSLEVVRLLNQFLEKWFASREKGTYSLETSGKIKLSLTSKLFQTGRLDKKLLKNILNRLEYSDAVITSLVNMSYIIATYQKACHEKGFHQVESTAIHLEEIVDLTKFSLESENRLLQNQIDRCTLYYQSKINTDAFRVAFASLVLSTVAILLAIVSTFKLI